jgi:hypothetical protein
MVLGSAAIATIGCAHPGTYYPVGLQVPPLDQAYAICEHRAHLGYGRTADERMRGRRSGLIDVAAADDEAARYIREARNTCMAEHGWLWRRPRDRTCRNPFDDVGSIYDLQTGWIARRCATEGRD